ncbi:MAG: Peptidyl-tRNA hydrolase ArfB [Bacteroidia bacterium]|nr:Peptidyl-tRNA hydrolase ArfB [Bacteroidia bacterium]
MKDFTKEFQFKTSRSGGPGGQNVNKTETKVELIFDVHNSALLSGEEKQQVVTKLASRISDMGLLQLSSSSERTQLGNKQKVIKKFYTLLEKALRKEKKRIPTKISKAQKEARLKKKKQRTEIKQGRRRVDF